MEVELYSDKLTLFSGDIGNPQLRESLKSLEVLIGNKLEIFEWSESRLAVSVEIEVDLPSLGNYDNLDIRPKEPVLIVFDIAEYPMKAPIVFTNRLDFPKNRLAHLYVAVNGRPPAFCYVRGDAGEWYANKRVKDLIIRISNWLRDAANGELTENSNQFDPLRLENYSGIVVYDYDQIDHFIKGNSDEDKVGTKFRIALFERPDNTDSNSYRFIKPLTVHNIQDIFKEVDEEKKKGKSDVSKKYYHFGYILWNGEEVINGNYEIDLPNNWEEFKSFCVRYKIDCSILENFIANHDPNEYVHFPVIIGLRRPSQIIGYSSNIEFVNFRFRVDTVDVENGKIKTNIPINVLSHNQPLTQNQASLISGFESDVAKIQGSIVFGCGALGSKIVLHLARSGITNFILLDHDRLSSHNLVRHTLYGEDVGQNKASALKKRIDEMFPYEKSKVLAAPSFKDGVLEKKETFEKKAWIFDFTASEAFFNKLVGLDSIQGQNVVRAYISNFGDLGILLIEGQDRLPRMDDLQAYLYSLSLNESIISDWLKKEEAANNNANLLVRVGVGCNSETTILADDKVSSHASFFSSIIKREMKEKSKEGKVCLNIIEDAEEFGIITKSIEVRPFDVFSGINDPTWSIRFKDGILEDVNHLFNKSGEVETGGVFMGVCNFKNKTIHVLELIDAPIDSDAGPTYFTRGHKGLSEEILKINEASGGQIGYIGEWHTHPDGPNILSDKDNKRVSEYKEEFSKLPSPLPVFITVVTPDGLFPYVY